jgi:L-2-hydroxyglutarate oxidase
MQGTVKVLDYCIIGGGIVGLATAYALLKDQPGATLALVEKEDELSSHQTGHNSGVIHAGIYYAPGSLKATLCKEGLRATIQFCEQNEIAFNQCGKLIVATNLEEEARIDALYERAVSNGLNISHVSQAQLKELEPNVAGTRALLSPDTGIVDYRAVANKLASVIQAMGGSIHTAVNVCRIDEQPDCVSVSSDTKTWTAKRLVVCGGLQADRLARLAGLKVDFRIVPFRGEYFQLPESKNEIVRHLIYPAPDPSLPFLGVHLTRMIDGSVTVGPNAVLGLSREGYAKGSVNLQDLTACLTFDGFWKLVWTHRGHALHELWGSTWKPAYLKECRKYCPSLDLNDLLPYRAGIRAQVVTETGVAVHDFMFGETKRMLHVYNAPSPAATSAIPIGQLISRKVRGEHVKI